MMRDRSSAVLIGSLLLIGLCIVIAYCCSRHAIVDLIGATVVRIVPFVDRIGGFTALA